MSRNIRRIERMCQETGGNFINTQDRMGRLGVCEVGQGHKIRVHDNSEIILDREEDEIAIEPHQMKQEGNNIVVDGISGYVSDGSTRHHITGGKATVNRSGISYEERNRY